jgi:hypothetical protein
MLDWIGRARRVRVRVRVSFRVSFRVRVFGLGVRG